MEITLDGIAALERDFGRVATELSAAARRAAETAAKEGVAEAKAHHRYQDHTPGTGLTDSAYAKLETSAPGGAVAVMCWPVPYASFVENGTPRHTIFGNPTLHFVWKGVPVFFRWVDHPGTKAYGFVGDAYLKAERVLYRELEIGVFRGQRILDSGDA